MSLQGNVFRNIPTVVVAPIDGQLFTSPITMTNKAYSECLGIFVSSITVVALRHMTRWARGSSSTLEGRNIPSASAYTSVELSVLANAG